MKDELYPFPSSPTEISVAYQRAAKFARVLQKTPLLQVSLTGTENILAYGPKIDAYTHYTDAMDIVAAGYAELQTSGYPERFAYKDEYLDISFKIGKRTLRLSDGFRALDGFPIVRNAMDIKALEHSAALLQQGHIVAIAPQGEAIRDKDSKPKLISGVGLIAVLGGAPIQPRATVGRTHRLPYAGQEVELFSRKKKIPNLSVTNRLVVRAGEVISLPDGAEDYTLDKLPRKYNSATDEQEVVLPKEALRLRREVAKELEESFYANYDQAREDYLRIYGKAA